MSAVIGVLAKPIGDVVSALINRFIPDKTQAEKDSFALAMQQAVAEAADRQAQLAIDAAEAASPDRINHWRGGLGWSVVAVVIWHFIAHPLANYFGALGTVIGLRPLPTFPDVPDADLNLIFNLALVLLGAHGLPVLAGIAPAIAAARNHK